MKKKICAWILSVIAMAAVITGAAQADGEGNILQAYCVGQTITVFTDTALDSNALACVISNQQAEVTASGLMSDGTALARTTILLDVSASMPSGLRDAAAAAVQKLIEYKPANEEYKLVVFGDDITVLHDFSADRYDLAEAVKDISFDNNESKVYEALYNTIPQMDAASGTPVLYRTIVITDGADDTATGITKEELFIRLQNEHYPIDVVAVSEEAAENRDLSAIARISCGSYHALNADTDAAALAQALGRGDCFYLEATVPDALLDGSVRQVDCSDQANTLSIDVKFPAVGAPVVNTPASSETMPPEAAPVETTPEGTAPMESASMPAWDFSTASNPASGSEDGVMAALTAIWDDYMIFIVAGGGAFVVILAAVIVLIVVLGKKKKKAVRTDAGAVQKTAAASGTAASGAAGSGSSAAAKTEALHPHAPEESQCTIKISDLNHPGRAWTLPIPGELLIGRAEHCPIRLEDPSVSREHCKIVVEGAGLVVVHLSPTNQTVLNESAVEDKAPLQSGDTLKIGRENLQIDSIRTVGDQKVPPRSAGGNVTRPLFRNPG